LKLTLKTNIPPISQMTCRWRSWAYAEKQKRMFIYIKGIAQASHLRAAAAEAYSLPYMTETICGEKSEVRMAMGKPAASSRPAALACTSWISDLRSAKPFERTGKSGKLIAHGMNLADSINLAAAL